MFLVVYSIRHRSARVQIGSGLIRFGLFWVRVYIGSIRVQVGLDSTQVISNFGSIWVITVSDQFGFGSVQFRISGQNRFNSFSCWFGSGFELFGSSHFCQVYVPITFGFLDLPLTILDSLFCLQQILQKLFVFN